MKILALVAICQFASAFHSPSPVRRSAKPQLKAVAEHVDSAILLHSWFHDAASVFSHAPALDVHAHHGGHELFNSFSLADGGDVVTSSPPVEQYGSKPVDKTGVIGFIATYIEQTIDFFHTVIPGKNTYGFSIILFTVLIKLATLPLTKIQLESTTRMQKLTPLQERIKAAYPRPEDEQMRNQQLSQLFQTANVNPLAGCFPALAQIPIFISLYRALQNLVAENKLDEGFLWIPDLQGPIYNAPPGETFEWVKTFIAGNPILGQHDTLCFLSIPLILAVSQTLSIKVLQPPQDPNKVLTDQEQFSKGLTNNLPLIIAFFSVNVPAGLSLYWIINNALTTIISATVKNSLKDEVLPAEVDMMMANVETGRASTRGGGGGGGGSAGGLSASKRAMQQVRESAEKKKKSFDPAVIQEVSAIEAREVAEASKAAIDVDVVDSSSSSGGNAEEAAEDPNAPKGPIGKMLKAGNSIAAKAQQADETKRFAQASAAAMDTRANMDVAPNQRPNPDGAKKRKKRTKPSQKKGKK